MANLRRHIALLLGLICLFALAGCFGNGFHWPWEGAATVGGAGKAHEPLGPRDEFAHLLAQLQWVFIGAGLAALAASIWVPIISTRHAVGSIVVGVCVAVVKPWLVMLYYPTIILLGLAAAAAVWPYAVAVITWFRVHITGGIDKSELTAGWSSIQTLWKPRSSVVGGSGNGAGMVNGVGDSAAPPKDTQGGGAG